jgi:hypothetical protein
MSSKKQIFIFLGIPILLGILFVLRYKILVLLCIFGGYFVSPEGSAVLTNYCFHETDTLILDSSYLQRSPVIVKLAKKMRVGQTVKCYGFKQYKDYRLSYALNPFTISRSKQGYTISQWIAFDTTGKVHTTLNLYLFKVRVPDNFVHTFDCTPFMVISKFRNLKE